jgi:hypothetical protein
VALFFIVLQPFIDVEHNEANVVSHGVLHQQPRAERDPKELLNLRDVARDVTHKTDFADPPMLLGADERDRLHLVCCGIQVKFTCL